MNIHEAADTVYWKSFKDGLPDLSTAMDIILGMKDISTENQTALLAEVAEVFKNPNSQLILEKDQSGKICQSIANATAILKYSREFQGHLRFNVFVNRIEITESAWHRYTNSFDDADFHQMRAAMERYGMRHSQNIQSAIENVARENPYHPIIELLNKLPPWDGIDRMPDLLPHYLGAKRCNLTTEATRLILMGALSRVNVPGTKFDIVVCFIDPNQGGGKSTLVKLLAMDDSWFTDGISNFDDDKVYEKISGHWMVELGEMLATTNTKTVESIKAFISRTSDSYRTPYSKFSQDIPRQCIFIGTSNLIDCLPADSSGNRRFIPVRCNREKAVEHPLDDEKQTRGYIKQLWAQALQIYRSGDFTLYPSREVERELDEARSTHTHEDEEVGLIRSWLEANPAVKDVCIQQVWQEVLGGIGVPKRQDSMKLSKYLDNNFKNILERASGSGRMKFEKYGTQRYWRRKTSDRDDRDSDRVLMTEGFLMQSGSEEIPFD